MPTGPSSSRNISSSDAATNPESEGLLVARAQRGDRQAFESLVAPCAERLYAVAFRLLGNRDDAVELTEEAFLRAFGSLRRFRRGSHLYTWIYRILLNLCYRRLTTRRRELPESSFPAPSDEEGSTFETHLVDPSSSPREEASRRETVSWVRQGLARLKPADYEILILREFEGLSYEELSRQLKVPRGTVMSRLHRARLALAEHLHKCHREYF